VSALNVDELRRYSRHLLLPEFGEAGQEKLKDSRVLVVGAGGLGSPLALYLAAAGVGTLGLVDADVVDATNLHRQLLDGTKDVGRPKLAAAAERLNDVNPHVAIEPHETMLTSANALEIVARYDVVADGTDNFPTRYLVNDACVLTGRPNVYGSIFRFEGQASVFATPGGPCYRCLYPEPPPPGAVPTCAEGGVLGILPGIVGLIQANETVKLLVGIGESLAGRLLLFDALAMRFRELRLKRDPDCPVCGPHPTVTALIDYEAFCGLAPAPGPAAVSAATAAAAPAALPGPHALTVRELEARRARGDGFSLLDVREPIERRIASIDGSVLIPMGEVPARLGEIARDKDVVVYCHHGQRSARVIEFLVQSGFDASRLWNLTGGIDAWSREVDPAVPTY